LAWLVYHHLQVKFGYGISYKSEIGGGLYLPHYGGINVSEIARIGLNCNLSQLVTIGVSRRGELKGVPVIGNEVYIGPGAVIFGAIHVGDRAAIGANCVVTKDVPEDAVMAGVPGKVISDEGSTGYIHNIMREAYGTTQEQEWDLVITPRKKWYDLQLDEVWRYRDLIALFVRRDFVTRVKQTILGPLWLILQPILSSLVFTVIFGNIAKLSTDGLPQMLFYMSGNVLWNYFSNCLRAHRIPFGRMRASSVRFISRAWSCPSQRSSPL